jgi:Protein of unknown function (DUF2950)
VRLAQSPRELSSPAAHLRCAELGQLWLNPIMSIVNRDGVVHECNLGPDTAARARAIAEYNPDHSWKRVAT